jgi:hypothetical protein
MTGLIAGAILLIVGSAVALIFGWIGSNETLIWTSIAGSVGAAVCLALAYYRSKQETSRPRRRRPPEPGAAAASPAATNAVVPTPVASAPSSSVSQDTQAMAGLEPDQVVVTAGGSRFHRTGCPQARGATESVDRDEAKRRGLQPCRVCRP